MVRAAPTPAACLCEFGHILAFEVTNKVEAGTMVSAKARMCVGVRT